MCIYNVAQFIELPLFKHVLGRYIAYLTWTRTVYVGCSEALSHRLWVSREGSSHIPEGPFIN